MLTTKPANIQMWVCQMNWEVCGMVTNSAYTGIALIEKDVEAAWRDHHSLCMGLYSLRVVLQNLVCDFAAPPCEELLPRATTALEKSEIYVLLHDRHEAEVL